VKLLLDEQLDHRLRTQLAPHEVLTVQYLGWGGLKNGELLSTAEQYGIEVFLTGDQQLQYQQNRSGRRMAILVLSTTNWPIMRHHLKTIAEAISKAAPGSFQEVECGRFSRRRILDD
jgi:predicted nuclease of predicted toxin-antitoxin system